MDDFDYDFQGEANPGFTGYTISDDPGNNFLDYDFQGEVNPGFTRHTISDDPGYTTATDYLSRLRNLFKGAGTKAADFATSGQGIMALLSALASYKDRAKPSGGGVGTAYAGYKPLTRTMQGNIARYAAQGGIMHAYANGGKVQMEDGGFVMTKRAVDGAGGPQGIAQLVPGARMIGGPPDPTGKRDLTPAVINGPHGQTPARVSRGEAYVTPEDVEEQGGSQRMYALMNKLQRRA